eukprot:scaffold13479_cov79-Isochrysis_galbana.AAC.1
MPRFPGGVWPSGGECGCGGGGGVDGGWRTRRGWLAARAGVALPWRLEHDVARGGKRRRAGALTAALANPGRPRGGRGL